jgi:D-alanyl-D-alanine dipeptidase
MVSIFLLTCKGSVAIKKNNSNKAKPTEKEKDKTKHLKIDSTKTDSLASRLIQNGLIDIQTLDARIFVDLKYADTHNFMHKKVYTTLQKAFLQKEVALKVAKAQQKLSAIDSNLHLLIYDAARPRYVQQIMWDLLDTMPIYRRVKFVSNPQHGSIHNYGCAVDITVCDAQKTPLDMGAGFDDSREIAYPSLEEKFIANGQLSKQQQDNRKLLRKVMYASGMWNIPSEWWHFNGMTRAAAQKKYKIIE